MTNTRYNTQLLDEYHHTKKSVTQYLRSQLFLPLPPTSDSRYIPTLFKTFFFLLSLCWENQSSIIQATILRVYSAVCRHQIPTRPTMDGQPCSSMLTKQSLTSWIELFSAPELHLSGINLANSCRQRGVIIFGISGLYPLPPLVLVAALADLLPVAEKPAPRAVLSGSYGKHPGMRNRKDRK
ncbi:hypothetical protein CDAR_447591 [Caerostris darwini]|uniref:Uncharacterized protein n=1 Tax=Caerostris darwini TaxID=1538125 RepID=A0AAV4PTN0_9ARAC|nr:hypothetical protein CDAR_447591 [Caerostris darwini]